jgi:tetratricopeptide (TPR) repeat protein
MKRDYKILLIPLFILLVSWNSGKTQEKVDVLVVGTIHNQHAVSNFTYNDVLRILHTYKPDLICVEIRPEDFRAIPYLREMMLATQYGDLNGIKVEPIDWYDDKNNDRALRDSLSRLDHYIKLSALEDSLLRSDPDIQKFNRKYGEDIFKNKQLDLMFWNSEDFNKYVRLSYKISLEVYGDSPFNLHYITRNRNMLNLINDAITSHNSHRVIVLTGGEHKSFFDDSLSIRKNVRLLSIESLMPLDSYDNTKLLSNELPGMYFQKDVSTELKEEFYHNAVLPLVHGMGMDFFPSIITENSIEEYKYIVDNWSKDIPNSIKVIYEHGWYNFLKGNYTIAIKMFNKYIKELEASALLQDTAFDKGFTYAVIAKCYDIEGNRSMAIEYYNKSIPEIRKKNQERLIDYIVTPYLKEPYKR